MFKRRVDCALSCEHDALCYKGQKLVIQVANVLFKMVNLPAFHQRIPVVARNAILPFDVAEDGKSLGLLIGQRWHNGLEFFSTVNAVLWRGPEATEVLPVELT